MPQDREITTKKIKSLVWFCVGDTEQGTAQSHGWDILSEFSNVSRLGVNWNNAGLISSGQQFKNCSPILQGLCLQTVESFRSLGITIRSVISTIRSPNIRF